MVVGDQCGFRAEPSDYAECRALHRRYGTTYYYATRWFPPEVRDRVHALYGFVRVPDEWVDNPNGADPRAQLQAFRRDLIQGLNGIRPDSAVLRAFCEVARSVEIDQTEPILFLDAMEADLTVARYETYADLQHYMRGSASAVGVMMCAILGADRDPAILDAAMKLGEAMQLTNFLRDVGEDLVRGRIYLPQEDMQRFGVTEDDLKVGRVTEDFRKLMKFEIARARELYAEADLGIPRLPKESRRAVQLARILYARILDRIEERDYDVFTGRARTSRLEKLQVATRVLLNLTT
jgi:phytoene synthase